jgi:hypothetical protein
VRRAVRSCQEEHKGDAFNLAHLGCCLDLLAAKSNAANRDQFFRLLELQPGLGAAWAEEVRKGWEDFCAAQG